MVLLLEGCFYLCSSSGADRGGSCLCSLLFLFILVLVSF